MEELGFIQKKNNKNWEDSNEKRGWHRQTENHNKREAKSLLDLRMIRVGVSKQPTYNSNNNYSGLSSFSSFRYVSLSCCVTVGGILRVTLNLFLLFTQHTISNDTEKKTDTQATTTTRKPTGHSFRRRRKLWKENKKLLRSKNISTWMLIYTGGRVVLRKHVSTPSTVLSTKRPSIY